MSALVASWHTILRDATQQERWDIFVVYVRILCGVALLASISVYFIMDDRCDRYGRYRIRRYIFAFFCATFEGIFLLGMILAYIAFPSLIAGRYLSPTCAARRAREGDEALFCSPGRLATWLWRFSIGKRSADLGEFEPFWKDTLGVCAIPLAFLIFGLVVPAPEKPPKRDHRQESKGTQT